MAEELGIDKDNIFILSSGDVLELDEESAATLLELDSEPGRPVTAQLPE